MSDNPMYWAGHQRPAWHQQSPAAQPPVNSMGHYASHPGSMLGNPMTSTMPTDPSLAMQPPIPGRHPTQPQPPHQSPLTHQSALAPPGSQSTLYPGMMSAPGSTGPARPPTQMGANSHLSSATQGMPTHPGLQPQPTHPQSHYPHQYSSIPTSYWTPPPISSQSGLGPSGPPPAPAPPQSSGPQQNPTDNSNSAYHANAPSSMTMSGETRAGLSSNATASMQSSSAPSFHSPKDIQSSEHLMSYDRQRASLTQPQQQQTQQQHPSAIMSQSIPSSTASNLSPTQSQLSIQGRIQPQSQLDSMRSMQQQASAVSNWSTSYYSQPSQSTYMNPYMPYGTANAAPSHPSQVPQVGARLPLGQKPSTDITRAPYPHPHGTSLYGQPHPTSGHNSGYYGYDSYYNQVTSQATSDPYLSHNTSSNTSQHWPQSSANNNQLINNGSTSTIPSPLRPQTGPTNSAVLPKSPSASSTLPPPSVRAPPPPSQTPERSPAPQHQPPYSSPNQQASTKNASSSLAQLEQMVMPGTNQASIAAVESPTHRSSTSSPSTVTNAPQLQYSYNSSGQGNYFSTGAGAVPGANQTNYYQQYDPSTIDPHKSSWADPTHGGPMNIAPVAASSGPIMMDSNQAYGQPPSYDGPSSYGDYTPLSTPANRPSQSRFQTPGDTLESNPNDKSDPYAIDSQTFDEFDDPSNGSKTKKGRAKKGEDKGKKERKPRAPRTAKASGTPNTQQVQSPTPVTPVQMKPSNLPQTPDMSPAPQSAVPMSYPSPIQQSTTPNLSTEPTLPKAELSNVQSTSVSTPIPKSPSQRLSTESPGANRLQHTPQPQPPQQSPALQPQLQQTSQSQPQQSQPMQYSYSSGQSSYYGGTTNVADPTQQSYYPTYETNPEVVKSWTNISASAGTESPLSDSTVPPAPILESGPTTPFVHPQVPAPALTPASATGPMPLPVPAPAPVPVPVPAPAPVPVPAPAPAQPPSQQQSLTPQPTQSQPQVNYENSSSFSECAQRDPTPQLPPKTSPQPDQAENVEEDVKDTSASNFTPVEEAPVDDASTQPATGKSKKGKAKKGEEKTKRERKSRAKPKPGADQTPIAVPTLAQESSSSNVATTSYQLPDNQIATTNQSMGDETTRIDGVTGSAGPNQGPYTYSNSGQGPYYPTPIADQASYYPPYDYNSSDAQGPQYVPSSIPTADNSQGPYQPTNDYTGTSAFGNFTPLEVPSAQQKPQTSQTTDLIPTEPNSTVLTSQGEDKSDQPAKSSKAKKPRVRKSGEKSKRDRKTRSAKAPQADAPQPDQPPTSPPNDEVACLDETLAAQANQSTSETVPVEVKPKRIRIRDKGKKKLPKFALKFAKTKKRKRLGSSDNEQSDLDKTPPPSPDETESGIQKRRSARNTKKLKYNDDVELGFSESDDESQIMPKKKAASVPNADGDTTLADDTLIADEPTVYAAPVEDTMVVEKLMATRMGTRELEPEPGEVLPPDGTYIDVEEFYVKYKNLSYLHCDWRTLEELERGDRRVAQKIKRYKQKKDGPNIFSFMEEEPFDLQYCEVDRILAVNEVEEMIPDEDPQEKEALAEKSVDESAPKPDETLAEVKQTDSSKVDKNALTDVKEVDATQIKNEVDSVEELKQETTNVELSTDSKPEVDNKPEITGDQDETTKTLEDTSKAIEDTLKSTDDAIQASEDTIMASDEIAKDVPDKENTNLDTPAESQQDSQPSTEVAILEEKPKKMKKKISRHYLVKWRGLSYEESTWELEDDLDSDKIKHFSRFKDPPPKSKWKTVKRPKPEEWQRKEKSPVYKNNNTLREYQLEGINWLSFCWHQGRNCILADEMGLGKTIQSIAFINEIYQYGINGPFLIIVPLSTVGNWAREFETWTDLNVITYHGSSTSREMLKEYEMFYRNEQGNRITQYYKFQVMITTFEIILSDCLDLREIPWRCCIIDEAHRLKNRNCKLLEGLRLLNMEHRVLLTGTPLQNNVEELFSLLNFLEPTQFSSTEQFLQEFGDLKTEAQVDKLKLILKPMMLRRLKEDVEKSLAPKEETIVEVELTNIQKKYYRAILERNFSFLSKGSTSNNMPNLMNTMMELRKCCIHPYLINGAEEQILYEAKQAKLAGGEAMSSLQAMINASGKLVLIDKLLPRLRADGHRVLIFSQMVRCLDILEDYVTHKHYPFERIDGRVRGNERQQAIDRFSKPGSDRFVFLLCTRAGGLGINLTAADTVIIFDSDWNPQNDLQAQARCHRIGQSKAVKIYRLICRNTYEREMFDKASLKLGLDKAVLQSMNTQKGGPAGDNGQLTKKEIEELLRKGAYGALMDDDNAGDKFCEEDIDHILLRRTQVITIDNSEAKGSTFSKATFSSSNNREDIELDDPNFWEKWAKKANVDGDDLMGKDDLIQLAPRRRTQTKRYGADGNLLEISDLESSEEDEETISMRTRGSRRAQPKLTPSSTCKRNKKNRPFDFDDEDYMVGHDGGFWSKSDCLKVEKGLLTYGWERWDKIISSNKYKRDISAEDCESICRVILLYCLNSYKGDEKIKSFIWELITPTNDASQSDLDSNVSSRNRRTKLSPPPSSRKNIADEITDSKWTQQAKNDPLIALPDDQYRRHLQRNCNRLLIRVKFLHYLKNDILKGYDDKISSECNISEIDLPPVPVDGELPANWWDDEADKSLLVGIFKHGHDKFNSMRQDPCLCFLRRCGPPRKEDLLAEMNYVDRGDDLDDENTTVRQLTGDLDNSAVQCLDHLVDTVVKDLLPDEVEVDIFDENKNSIRKTRGPASERENGLNEASHSDKMDMDEESLTNDDLSGRLREPAAVADSDELSLFPHPNDLNQRFRRLITAYQRNSKKLESNLKQKARDDLKRERYSKFEAARNEREERKRFLAQKWTRREEQDFFRAISSFGVEFDPEQQRYDWTKFRAIGKLEKKLDETMDEYLRAFLAMCKKVTSRPLTAEEENCALTVDTITEDRASRCLARIDFLNKIREQIITHPKLNQRLSLCVSQSDLPDWWENGIHDKDLLIAAARHGLTRLDYNLAHDPALSFDAFIRERAHQLFSQAPTSILIHIEQLQELLERNGIEYLKDLDLNDVTDDVKQVIESLIDGVESEVEGRNDYRPLTKSTRSSGSLSASRPMPNIISRRSANTIVKSAETDGLSGNSVRLTSLNSSRFDEGRVVEITPIMPDKIPDDLVKSFEAGEISITVQSESALLQLDDKAPIILFGAINPITVRIRWPKDKAIQTRLENLVTLVEKNEWPNPPRPIVPTITLPNHLAGVVPTPQLSISTSSPTKNDKSEVSLGSPRSDISNISSLTSRHESRDHMSDLTSSNRNRRGRNRKSKHDSGTDLSNMESCIDTPRDDRQAAAKLRNLLSQGPSCNRSMAGSSSGLDQYSADRMSTKFGNNKQGAGLSSLLASFKQKRSDTGGSSSSRPRDDKNILDLGASTGLLPQIFANMKPEFRELLANQDTAAMLLNSLSGIAGAGSIPTTNLRSTRSNNQLSLDHLINMTRAATTSATTPSQKGPPPAHQHMDNPPSAHSSMSRELRRSAQATRTESPSSISLRSGKSKSSNASSMDSMSLQSKTNSDHHHHSQNKMISGTGGSNKKRVRPSSSASDSPPDMPSADVLDLSSLPLGDRSPPSSRSKRHRDLSGDETSANKSSSSSNRNLMKSGSSKQLPVRDHGGESASEKNIRTTRASKRIGSRIDALALNLQAKRMHRGDSPPGELSPSLPKDKDSPIAAHGGNKPPGDMKQSSSKAPPAAHSGGIKTSSSSDKHQREKSSQQTPSVLSNQTSQPPLRQDPLSQLLPNPASLLGSLNSANLGARANDLVNQMLPKPQANNSSNNNNNFIKNLVNEFVKNQGLSLDPSTLAAISASLPLGAGGLPGFNLPIPTSTSTTMPSTSSKNLAGSLLNDFKQPSSSGNNTSSLMKRARQDGSSSSSSTSSRQLPGSGSSNNDNRRTSSTPDKHSDRKSSSDRRSSSSYQDRPDKHGKHSDRRSSNATSSASQLDQLSTDSSRRSSSSLLAQQSVPMNQPTNQIPATSSSQTPLSSSSPFNLAQQFGGLNSLGGLLNIPGMNELMKQMSGFPGLSSSMPRVSTTPSMPTIPPSSSSTNNGAIQSNGDKSMNSGSRRSRHSASSSTTQTTTSTPTSTSTSQANAALANSLMNLTSQANAAPNPYGNYTNALTNPFLSFAGLANLGMNNPLGMGLFPGLYMPPGFPPAPDQQQQQQSQSSSNQTGSGGSTGDGASKDKKMRYPRK